MTAAGPAPQRRILPLGLALATVLLAPAAAMAEAEREVEAAEGMTALPCRPTVACAAEFVPAGQTEVELGYAGSSLPGAVQHSTPLLLKFSVADALQLQLGTNGVVLQSPGPSYLDDLQLLAKLRLTTQGEARPATAVSLAMSFPTGVGTAGYRPGIDAQGIAYVSKDLGWLHADLNLALNLLELDRTARPQPWAALSTSVDLGSGLTPMLEGYAFAAALPAAPKDAGVLMALGWQAAPWLVLDAGGDVGLGHQGRAFTL